MNLLRCTLLLTGISFLFSCSPEHSLEPNLTTPDGNPSTGGGTFEVKIDGQLTSFKVFQATLLRSTADNQKRLDIAGVSNDGSKQLILTIGDKPAAGNTVNLKDYIIDLFNEDDPNTPEDESAGNDDGFITYSTSMGNNSWITDVYAENGVMKVTSCDVNTKKVSGTFYVKDSSLTGGPVINFTEGKFNNITYTVVN